MTPCAENPRGLADGRGNAAGDAARHVAPGARARDGEAIAVLCNGGRHAPSPPTEVEAAALAVGTLAGAPAYVEGDYPEWLDLQLARVFGDERAAEGAALASRAPLDLRVNTLAVDA